MANDIGTGRDPDGAQTAMGGVPLDRLYDLYAGLGLDTDNASGAPTGLARSTLRDEQTGLASRAFFDRVVTESLADTGLGLTMMLVATARREASASPDAAIVRSARLIGRYMRGIDLAVAIDDRTIAICLPDSDTEWAMAAGAGLRRNADGSLDLAIGIATRRSGDTVETLLARSRRALDAALERADRRIVSDDAPDGPHDAAAPPEISAAISDDAASTRAEAVFYVDVETLLRIPNQP